MALVPSVEFFRAPGYRIVSDACVACRGPVLSVKVLFRVPPKDVRRLALDEGSRTSAELSRILLTETFGVRPELEPLPVGCGPETTDADAVLLIGDRAIAKGEVGRGKGEGKAPSPCPLPEGEGVKAANFVEVWDLGERWTDWTRLPFVFAMWIAREGVEINVLAQA